MAKGGTGSDDRNKSGLSPGQIAKRNAEARRQAQATAAAKAAQLDATSTGPLSISDAIKNPDKALGEVTRSLDARKREFFWQIEDELLNSIDDTSIIDEAKASANIGYEQQAARTKRELARYGQTMTVGQQKETNRLAKLNKPLNYASTVNDARLKQFDRNEAVKTQLLNNSRALTGQAVDGLSTSASLATQRENAYQSDRADYKADKYSNMANTVSSAVMAMALL